MCKWVAGPTLMVLAAAAMAEPPRLALTADEAVGRALAQNAELAARAAELAAAEAEAKAAGRPEPLRLALSPATIWQQFEAAISSILDISGRRKWASRAARHEVAAMVAGNEEFTLELVAGVRSSYWRVRLGQERVALAEAQVEVARDLHAAAERLARAGIGRAIESDRAANEAREAELGLESARARLREAQTELAGLLYLPPETEIDAVDGVPAPVGPPEAGLQELALVSRPALRRVGSLARAALARSGIASAERYPDLEIGVEREEGMNFGRALLELPLIDFGTIKHGKRAARAHGEAAVAEVDVVTAEIRLEAQAAVDTLAASARAEARLGDELIPAQEDIVSRLTRGYEARSVTYLAVLEAQNALQELQSQWLDAVLDRLDAEVRLARALGMPLEEAHNANRDDKAT